MTITSFLLKHGFLPKDCECFSYESDLNAAADLRSLQSKPDVQPVFWHWPDRTIGKKESRRLREEHNIAMNQRAEMADGLRYLAEWLATNKFPMNIHHLGMLRLIHELEDNLDIKPPTKSRGDN